MCDSTLNIVIANLKLIRNSALTLGTHVDGASLA